MKPPVLGDLRAAGVSAWPSAGQLQLLAPPASLPTELRAAVSVAKPSLLAHLEQEVVWRADTMRRQLDPDGHNTFWPFLVAKAGPTAPGTCLSCGEPLLAVEHSRCSLCVEAVRRTMAAP
jgi:hypothetical protein